VSGSSLAIHFRVETLGDGAVEAQVAAVFVEDPVVEVLAVVAVQVEVVLGQLEKPVRWLIRAVLRSFQVKVCTTPASSEPSSLILKPRIGSRN
jgi:hypothetical protein